jgi:hypothetical protein
MKKEKILQSETELKILKDKYNVDLADQYSIKVFKEKSQSTLERIHKIEREIYFSMNPHRKKRIPSGEKCAFCLKSENEVHSMAKHESGFNLCKPCIKKLHSSE